MNINDLTATTLLTSRSIVRSAYRYNKILGMFSSSSLITLYCLYLASYPAIHHTGLL